MTPAERDVIDRDQVTTLYRDKIAELRAEVARLVLERDAARANFLGARDARDAAIIERDRYREAIRWALGEGDSFEPTEDDRSTAMKDAGVWPRFWWRHELRTRAALKKTT